MRNPVIFPITCPSTERVIRGLSDAVPALCRLMTDGVAEAGAEADVQGMMGPSPLRLGGDAGESPKPRWMRAVRMLVEVRG